MTIGIGVLGSRINKADTLVMVSDTLGSIGDNYSTSFLSKMFCFPDEHLYVVAADQIEKAAELVDGIRTSLRNLHFRSHGSIQDALIKTVCGYHRQRAIYEVLPRFGVTPEQWLLPMDESLRSAATEAWFTFDINCELIVGTFTDQGQAILYKIPGSPATFHEDGSVTMHFVEVVSFPGFSTIGTGGENARFWLAYRGHHLSCSPKRTAYHAYEAKAMAASSPHVNEKIEMTIANLAGHVHLLDRRPEALGWSLEEFKRMFDQYGPKSTEPLQAIEDQPSPQHPITAPSNRPPSSE